MKEYRIKAKSPDHRRAIIGALEGMGITDGHRVCDTCFDQYPLVGVTDGVVDAWADLPKYQPTHTSLDSLLEDIERDRRTVEVEISSVLTAEVTPSEIFLGTNRITLADFDRIAAAVKQVRG